MIELDVTLTQDRNVVVIHDETLDRTTNGKGNVRDHSFAELKKLDSGSWFASEFKNERLPSLDDVFSLCAGKTLLNIEIKHEAHEDPLPADVIEIQVLKKMQAYSMAGTVIISSFKKRRNPRNLNNDRRKTPIGTTFR